MEGAETRYAVTPLGKIAYQVVGDGPLDLLVEPRSWLPIDLMWDEPRMQRFLERLSSFARHIWFDPRGRGASDPVPHDEGRLAESIVDDMVALLDALGRQQVAVLGLAAVHELLFAATHPERVRALVLVEPVARFRWAEDYPEGWDDTTIDSQLASIEQGWGSGTNLNLFASSMAEDRRFARWYSRCERLAMNPAEARWRFRAAYHVDLRHVLAAINVPTLVIHRDDAGSALCRYVASHIAGARRAEGPEPGHFFFTGDTAAMLDAIEEFLTGRLPAPNIDRVLATMLFTDIVNSTQHASRLGDRRWLELLADHDMEVRAQLARFRGREVATTGDGFLATFDGPGRAIRAARAIVDALRPLGVDIRAGLHTGEVELKGAGIGGVAIHIAQRISALAQPGEVLVSSTVKDLVAGSGIQLEDRGEHVLKGVPESWRLHTVRA